VTPLITPLPHPARSFQQTLKRQHQSRIYLAMKYIKRFEPIESDPQILTKLMHRLGVQETFWFDDVLDYKEESQQPALALIAIFPESQNDELRKATFEAERAPIITDHIKFLRQTIDNSCGLIAVLHCVLNTAAANSISKPQDLW
jgi:ubiquitin carboxyl-terminal hydrolase L3